MKNYIFYDRGLNRYFIESDKEEGIRKHGTHYHETDKKLSDVEESVKRDNKRLEIDEEIDEENFLSSPAGNYRNQIILIKYLTKKALYEAEILKEILHDDYYVNKSRPTSCYSNYAETKDNIQRFFENKLKLTEDDIIYSDGDIIIYKGNNDKLYVIHYIYYYAETQDFVRGAYFYEHQHNDKHDLIAKEIIKNSDEYYKNSSDDKFDLICNRVIYYYDSIANI